jgi:hypothetical protein
VAKGKNSNLRPWKKGTSGNPKGKPRGSRNRSTIVRELLEADATDGAGGTIADQLVRALVKKASTGDVAAFRELMDSAFGKVRDEPEAAFTYTMMPTIKIGGKPHIFNVGEPLHQE